jgi:hypothetical protein
MENEPLSISDVATGPVSLRDKSDEVLPTVGWSSYSLIGSRAVQAVRWQGQDGRMLRR